MDIQQGNIVTSKMLLQLRPGMSRSQVRFIMGTPLIQDSFHKDRWDYFYQFRKDGKIVTQRRVILEFDNDSLRQVRGDTIPAGPDPTVPEQQSVIKQEEKGLTDRLKFWKKDEVPAAAAVEAKPEAAPAVANQPGSDQMDPALRNPPPASESRAAPAPVAPAAAAPEPGKPDTDMPPPPVAPTQSTPARQPAAPAKPAAETSTAPASPTTAPKAAATQKPADQSAQPAKPADKAPADDDLPPEEDPSYFERMLEKIGF